MNITELARSAGIPGTSAGAAARETDLANAGKRAVQGPAGEAKLAELEKVGREFEAFFLNLMLGAMRKVHFGENQFSGGRAEEMFTGMLDERMTQSAASQGSGLGIARMIVDQFKNQIHSIPAPPLWKPGMGHVDTVG